MGRFNALLPAPYLERITRFRRDHRVTYGMVIQALVDEFDGKRTFLSKDASLTLDDLPAYIPSEKPKGAAVT